MDNFLNILIIEDNADDAFLANKLLERANVKFSSQVVSNAEGFTEAIEAHKFDIILCDNSMPQFSSRDVLNYLKERRITTPLIIFSGTVTEDYALQMIKDGAFDYVNKDDITSLAMVIKKAAARMK